MSTAVVEIVITRGTTPTTVTGWVAPAFSNAAGQQPARVYLEDATQDLLQTGDALTASGVTYAVEAVGWWPPDSIEAVLAGTDLPDTCTIERQTATAFNATTNLVTKTWSALWSGPCCVEVGTGVSAPGLLENAAELMISVRGLVQVPASVYDVAQGDRVTINTSRDTRLVGTHLAITAVQMDTTPALRNLNVSDVR